ncbi:hypothetical protein [Breoghania sp.]|uniref:hypothetical protein n=1 Tax=Breoghania sp. TaxID=2065378 RepID=UPI0026360CA1|nr:hypothetical protein [Breoghania sp.]MDJ0930197.1 hypothetical protein [Breoghania sp.]
MERFSRSSKSGTSADNPTIEADETLFVDIALKGDQCGVGCGCATEPHELRRSAARTVKENERVASLPSPPSYMCS